MEKLKSQKGVISLFVLISMLFLLIFIFSIYQVVISKKKSQESKFLELQKIYSKDSEEIEEFLYADENEVIPIYNIKELNIVGTGEYINIKNKVYRCGSGSHYILKNNIFVDIKEALKLSSLQINDYKLYSNNFFIDKDIYELYYYYEFENEDLWKCIAYQKFSKEDNTLVENQIYLENKFCDLDLINNYCMMIWKDKKGEINNLKIEEQTNKINSVYDIAVFNKHYNEVDKADGEFYLFTNIKK